MGVLFSCKGHFQYLLLNVLDGYIQNRGVCVYNHPRLTSSITLILFSSISCEHIITDLV